MSVLIFKTNIKSRRKARMFGAIFRRHPFIYTWSIDFEDRDRVLRIESSEEIKSYDVVRLVTNHGFICEDLPD